MSRAACVLVLLVLLIQVTGTGCRSLTEEEALELAREEIREEMAPEIERREAEIARLEQEISRTKARIAKHKER